MMKTTRWIVLSIFCCGSVLAGDVITFETETILDGPSPMDWDLDLGDEQQHHGSEAWRKGGYVSAEFQGVVKPVITTEQARLGKKSLCLQLNGVPNFGTENGPHNQRTEFGWNRPFSEHETIEVAPGTERYMGFSFMQDKERWSEKRLKTDFFLIHQYKQKPAPGMPATYPFIVFGFDMDGDAFLMFRGGEHSKKCKAPLKKLFKPEPGVWYDIIVGNRFAPCSEDGFVTCWYKKSTEKTYQKFSFENTQVGYSSQPCLLNGFGFGMYKRAENSDYRIYFDEIRDSATAEGAKILGSRIN
jgi:hypothetical protein